ncbi:MAG: hypothetical protein ABEN55_20465 [Bradymonadaceae bacterium]
MSHQSKRLDRRTFLRGLSGAAVGLPLLECMLPDGTRRAMAAGEEKPGPFFVTGFSGHAIGQGGSKDAERTGLFTEKVSPGDGLEVTRALEPLAEEFEHPSGETRQVRDYVSLDRRRRLRWMFIRRLLGERVSRRAGVVPRQSSRAGR